MKSFVVYISLTACLVNVVPRIRAFGQASLPAGGSASPATNATVVLDKVIEARIKKITAYPDLVAVEQVTIRGLSADSILLKETHWEPKPLPQQAEPSVNYRQLVEKGPEAERRRWMDRIDNYIQIWAIHAKVDDPAALKSSLTPTDKPHQRHREVFCLGQENGITWYGYVPILDFYKLATAEPPGMVNGDAVIPALLRGVALGYEDFWTSEGCRSALRAQGANARPAIDQAIADRLPYRVSLVDISRSTAELVGLTDSKDEVVAQAAKNVLLSSPKAELTDLYARWLADGAGKRSVQYELAAYWTVKAKEAAPSLARILAAPASPEEYRTALEFSH